MSSKKWSARFAPARSSLSLGVLLFSADLPLCVYIGAAWCIVPANLRESLMPPKLDGILESSLYVSDVARSVRFYEEIFGFRVISDFGERGCAMQAGPRQVLLLFKKGGSRTIQSPHDGDGE